MGYLAGSLFAILFWTLEKQILAPLLLVNKNDDENDPLVTTKETNVGREEEELTDSWKEFAKGIEGMYFVFSPFIPCLLWSLIVRCYWLKERKVSSFKKDN